MKQKNKSTKILFLRKKLIEDEKPEKFFSFSNTNKTDSPKKIKFTKSNKKKSLIRKNVKRKSTIQIKYKGITKQVRKVDYYKMKNVDFGKLVAHKKQNIELIKQKKIFERKENEIFNVEKMDLISKLKENEYRIEIRNLQKKLLNKTGQKNEIYQYYETIMTMIKEIEKHLTSTFEKQRKIMEDVINFDVKQLDFEFISKFDKRCEFSDWLVYKIKEIIVIMIGILKSHKELNSKIIMLNKDNLNLRKKIKYLNDINNSICMHIKKIKFNLDKTENVSNNDEKSLLVLFKKIQNNTNKKHIDRGNEGNNTISGKKLLLSNDNYCIGHTYYTSNNINLTSKNNSKNNQLSLTNNLVSISNSSIQNQEKTYNEIQIKEINYINTLKNRIKNLKISINQMKKNISQPKNAFYSLVIKIIRKLHEEESEKVFDRIDYKLLNENMKLFPLDNFKVRKKFLDLLFSDVKLYKILTSKNLEGINYFQMNLFNRENEKHG